MLRRLSSTEYQRLVEDAHTTHDPRALHRAQALLWLHEGDTVEEVATPLVRLASHGLPLVSTLSRASGADTARSAR